MRVFRALPAIAFTLEKLFAKNLPTIRQAHPDARQMFRAFFVAAGAKSSRTWMGTAGLKQL
jgi:hypothetical protein